MTRNNPKEDYQREAVYEVERRTMLPASFQMDTARKTIETAWTCFANQYFITKPPSFVIRDRRSIYNVNSHSLVIQRSFWDSPSAAFMVIHELCHAILYSYGVGEVVPWHGGLFVGLECFLWSLVTGQSATELQNAFRSNGVAVTPIYSKQDLDREVRRLREEHVEEHTDTPGEPYRALERHNWPYRQIPEWENV